MQLNYFTYKEETFTCPACGWSGKGIDLGTGDFSEAHFICDMDCPSCHKTIGFWQAPLKEEAEQWYKEHPGANPAS